VASKADADRLRSVVTTLRSQYGVEVLETPGCYGRGLDWTRRPTGEIDHHDASSRKSGEWGALGIIVAGRSDVTGPLSQFQIARCLDGQPRLAAVAAGRANQAGKGGPLIGVPRDNGNSYLLGAESANDGLGEPYTLAAHYAHDALFRVCSEVYDFPVSHVIGHKEWAPGRKSDPLYSMAWRRAGVAGIEPRTGEQMNGDQDARLRNVETAVTVILQQLCGPGASIANPFPGPAKAGGWPTTRYGGPGVQERGTLVMFMQWIDRQLNSTMDLAGRPAGVSDNEWGHVLSMRGEVREILDKLEGVGGG
jgi:hypothetical protein